MDKGTMVIDGREYSYSPLLSKDDGNSFSTGFHYIAGEPWNIFRSDLTWTWENSWYSPWMEPMPQFIGYKFDKGISKQGAVIYIDDYNIVYHHPRNFSIEYLDAGIWKIAKTVENAVWIAQQPNIYWFDKVCKSTKFRVHVTDISTGSATIHRLRLIDSSTYYLYQTEDSAIYGITNI